MESTPPVAGGSSEVAKLATRFHAALAETRQALGPHAALLPGGRIAKLDALLHDFERRRVRLAVYGEVKAGKSTLVNALAGAELSPASFGPLTSVPVRITWGDETSWSADGTRFATVEELAAAMRAEASVEEVTVTTDVELLRLGGQLDLVDTPGVGSEDRFDEISAGALRALDAVVLVVRYPALFTKFTRHLMASLESDIGKLFVVWNFDGACEGLSDEERDAQVESLRQRVAGAHELYTVDARRALAAAQAGDLDGQQVSGLTELVDGLRRFAHSGERHAAAVREAAKRVDQWMRQADDALHKRQSQLEASIEETRRRLEQIERDAAAQSQTVREGFEAFRGTLAQLGDSLATEADERARGLRKQLRKLRRRWFWNGDAERLTTAVRERSEAYANAVDEALKNATNEIYSAAESFGTRVTAAPRERIVPAVDALGPAERLQRASEGRLRRTRRSLRRGWYLTGFPSLYQEAIDAELATQKTWAEQTTRIAVGAAQATLDAQLAEIERAAGEAAEALARERKLADEERELEALRRDVPVVSRHRAGLAAMAAEARRLA